MQKLHQAPVHNHQFPSIEKWLSVLNEHWELPKHYLKKARILRDQLMQNLAQSVLLHGDLHHDNILRNGNDWVVIDPKGVIGAPIHEVWAFLNNPEPMSVAMVVHRAFRFAEILNLDYQAILDWCFVQSIVSWIWDLQDNLNPSSIWITEIIDSLTI